MKQITLRIRENTLESIDSDADEHGVTRSEHIRNTLESHAEHGDPEELRDEVDALKTKLAERDERIDELERERDRLADEAAEVESLRERVTELQRERDEAEAERDRLADTVDTLEAEIDDLESEVESLDARNTDLTNQLAEANSRIDTTHEIVEYVENERTAQERYREAGLLGKVKYTVFGMDTNENNSET